MSEIKDYIDLKIDEIKLRSTQGLSDAMGRLATGLLLVGLLIIVLGLLAVVLIHWLGELTGSLAIASSIVCGVFLVVFLVVYSQRKRLFRDTFVQLFINIFFDDDKEEIKRIADKAEEFCNDVLDLRLSKKSLFHTYQGVDFVGYRHFKSGKVLVRKRTARQIMRKLKALPMKLNDGRIKREKARSIVASADGWLQHANTYNLRQSLEMWRLKGMVASA